MQFVRNARDNFLRALSICNTKKYLVVDLDPKSSAIYVIIWIGINFETSNGDNYTTEIIAYIIYRWLEMMPTDQSMYQPTGSIQRYINLKDPKLWKQWTLLSSAMHWNNWNEFHVVWGRCNLWIIAQNAAGRIALLCNKCFRHGWTG